MILQVWIACFRHYIGLVVLYLILSRTAYDIEEDINSTSVDTRQALEHHDIACRKNDIPLVITHTDRIRTICLYVIQRKEMFVAIYILVHNFSKGDKLG